MSRKIKSICERCKYDYYLKRNECKECENVNWCLTCINETKYIKYTEWRRMINWICKLLSEVLYKCKKLIQK